jgi:hypothetical protein
MKFRLALFLLALFSVAPARVLGQQDTGGSGSRQKMDAQRDAKTESSHVERAPHRFWDKENDWLFAGVAASRTFDYFSTLNLRRRHGNEILITNDAVDNHAAFATIEAAGTGVSLGASYLFHRYNHHQLERWMSMVHIGLATSGAVRNYSIKGVRHP